MGGDHEDQGCYDTVGCRTEAQIIRFLERLKKAAIDEPSEPYPIAHAVYAHTRLRRTATAVDLAIECSSVEWWCDLLRGLAHHHRDMPERAEEYFRRGLLAADRELACRLAGVGELLTRRDRDTYDDLNCSTRTEFEARFWWLADPMFSMPGNDRWTEHISRRFELVLHEPIVWLTGNQHPRRHEVSVSDGDRTIRGQGSPDGPTRILRGVGILAETGAAEVSWTEPASGSVHPMALALDISRLDAGDYELRIDVSAGDGNTATTIRTFRLEG